MISVSNCTVVFKINVHPFTQQQFLAIARRGANTVYNPRRFHAIIMRMRYGQSTVSALVFRSARVVLTGVPHPDMAQKMAKRVARRIQHTQSVRLHLHHVRVVNIVGVHTFARRLDLVRLAKVMDGTYDPSIFPALRCKLENGATCLLYISGKAIVTGVDTMDLLNSSFDSLIDIVPKFYRK